MKKISLLTTLFLLTHITFAQINMTGTESSIVLTNFKFRHPMTSVSAEEIVKVKDRISKGIEPQKSSYNKLVAAGNVQLYFIPDPPDSMNIISGYDPGNTLVAQRAWLWKNCSCAYTCALAYAYTGETKYADKAVAVLNAWATKGTVFYGGDAGLQLGSYFSPMLYAADLLHDYAGWTTADRAKFKTWWTNRCLYHTKTIMNTKFNNWLDAGLLGVMSAAVVFEDTSLLQSALNKLLLYFQVNPGSSTPSNPSWKMSIDSRGYYLTDEVDRNLGRSGLTYTYYSLTTGVQCFEIARYAGYNFWTAKTTKGATYKGVIEQLFKWSIVGDTFPFYTGTPDNDKANQFNSYEIANSNFKVSSPIAQWLSTNRPVIGAQGDEYVTLNKGDMFNYSVTGIDETKMENVRIFRQNDGALNIKLFNNKKVDAIIYNKLGMKIKQLSLSNGDNLLTLPINDLYLIQVENNVSKILL
jgi:Alginate lyase